MSVGELPGSGCDRERAQTWVRTGETDEDGDGRGRAGGKESAVGEVDRRRETASAGGSARRWVSCGRGQAGAQGQAAGGTDKKR